LQILGFWGGFGGLEGGGNRGQTAMFLVSKERYFSTQAHAAQNIYFYYPNFSGFSDFTLRNSKLM
jgi:hypothetical protein